MLDWLVTARLRPVLTLIGLTGLLALGACGGGSGAPNNPYTQPAVTPPLILEPPSLTAYSGVPTTVTITSGVAPFFAFTSNASVLPVSQNVAGYTVVLLPNNVTADTVAALTVQDSAGQTKQVAVTIKAAPIFNSLTFAPASADCGTDLCSGESGTATVIATGPGGAPLTSRQIRFEVVFGPVGIASSNPAMPLVQTLTVVTDSTGTATAVIQALVNATTQPGQIRAIDVTSGEQEISNFVVVNNTVASGSPLAVIPPTATITSALASSCSTGFRIDYYIYGGNPPYTVSSTFPASVTLLNSTVSNSGGFFEAVTNGACVNPLVFTIVDSAGKQTTSQLINQPGTGVPPPPATLAVAPSSFADVCGGKTYSFIITGGTAPFNVSQVTNPSLAGVVVNPQVVTAAAPTFALTYPAAVPAGTKTTIVVVDSSTPPTSVSDTITCN